eukprot:613275-Ditylum_brightwellii.AAC.1
MPSTEISSYLAKPSPCALEVKTSEMASKHMEASLASVPICFVFLSKLSKSTWWQCPHLLLASIFSLKRGGWQR